MSKLRRVLQAAGAVVLSVCFVVGATTFTRWLDGFVEGKIFMLLVALFILVRIGVYAYRFAVDE